MQAKDSFYALLRTRQHPLVDSIAARRPQGISEITSYR
jgi:hypothetical protein